MKRIWRPIARWAPAGVAVALILAATLHPSDGGDLQPWAACLACGARGWANVVVNVILFLPLGAALALAGARWRHAVAAGFLLSLAIELAQMGIPGRNPSFGDLATNTAGAALGAALVAARGAWLTPPARRSGRLALATAVVAALVFGATGLLLRPAAAPAAAYAEWTPENENLEVYGGRVLTAAVGDLPIAPGPVGDPAAVDARLRRGEPLQVRVVAGPAPPRLAPVFGLYDADERAYWLLGVDRQDLVLHYRSRAAGLRLSQPELRLSGGLAAVSPGDAVELEVAKAPGDACFAVDGRRSCDHGYSIGRGWSLLYFSASFPEPLRRLLDLAWVAAFFFGFGYWARQNRASALGGGVLVSSVLALPPYVGLLPTPIPVLLAAGLACAGGALVAAWVRGSRTGGDTASQGADRPRRAGATVNPHRHRNSASRVER